jgi:hypothetical protein
MGGLINKVKKNRVFRASPTAMFTELKAGFSVEISGHA